MSLTENNTKAQLVQRIADLEDALALRFQSMVCHFCGAIIMDGGYHNKLCRFRSIERGLLYREVKS